MDLKSFVEKDKRERQAKSKFIILNEDESFTGEFLGIENYKSPSFGDQISFKFKVNGEEKSWNRGVTGVTRRLCYQMDELGIKEGDTVKINRLKNDGKASVFTVEKVNNGKNEEATSGNELEDVFK